MAKKNVKSKSAASLNPAQTTKPTAASFLRRSLVHVTGALGLLISISFFTATFDTAQVKLTLLHMGSLLLAALWCSLKIAQHQNPFAKKNIPFLLPVLAYIGWNVICYIFAPLHAEAAEEFIRFLFYGMITLLAATEFTLMDIKTITKWILVAIWISFLYAALQIIDGFFPGVDPMPWRGFFTKRIFSTHANPNFFADFVIFASCILGSLFLVKRQKKFLALTALGLISLFFTESKGAWLAYAAAASLGALLYVNYCAPSLKKHRFKLNMLAVLLFLAAAVLAGLYTTKRFQSISFRAHTWLASFEMIKDAPVLGVGTGNFKTIYAAYRRPQIFYIENSHNVETQHAENELLEQWAVSGTVGLAVFLWLLVFLFTLAVRQLKQENLPDQRNYYLLGYTTALAGMFVHSWVDISIRFASSGFFFALFMGFIIALCRPNETEDVLPRQTSSAEWLLRIEKCILAVGFLAVCGWIIFYFHQITSALGTQNTGTVILLVLAWLVLAGCLAGAGWVILRSAWLLRSAAAICPLLLLLPLEMAAYRPFQANHYYSLGISLNNSGNLEGAVGFFTKAINWDPLRTEYYQFRANLFTATLDLTKRFSPIRGDRKTPSDDFSRALQDYAVVKRRAPNHALLYHNQGQLYYTMALNRSEAARYAPNQTVYEETKQEALQHMAKAKQSFERSLLTDPVNPDTYVYLVQIALLENQPGEAQHWIDRFRQGPAGVTEPEFLQRHQTYPPMKNLQAQVTARLGK
ncbi:MAG: O-antigen ligase family protein [Elusimicrobiaceae bacterium]|nr:O-antigen ligase family protein [Elusimicrobiaceae bacterium]